MKTAIAASLLLVTAGSAVQVAAQDVILFRAGGGDLTQPAPYTFGGAPVGGTAVTSVGDLGNPAIGSFSFSGAPFGAIGGNKAFAAAHNTSGPIANMTQMANVGVDFGTDFSSPVTRVADAGSGDLLFADFGGSGGFTNGASTEIEFKLGSFGNGNDRGFKYNFVRGLDAGGNEVFELLFVAGSNGGLRDVYARGAGDDSTTLSSNNGDPSTADVASVDGVKIVDSSSSAYNNTSVANGRPGQMWNVNILLEDGMIAYDIGGAGTVVTTPAMSGLFPVNSLATEITRLEFSSSWNAAIDGQNKGYWVDDIGAFAVIPSPATVSLIGLGALAGVRRRR